MQLNYILKQTKHVNQQLIVSSNVHDHTLKMYMITQYEICFEL